MAATRLDLQHDLSRQERAQLVDRIITLEGDAHALQQEAQLWRQRCLESERDRAAAAASEDRAQLELHEAKERERGLAARSLELRLHKAEIESTAALSHMDAKKHVSEVQNREALLSEKDEELKSIRTELHLVRACSQEQDRLLRARDAKLEATKAELHTARADAQRQTERLQMVEADLKSMGIQLREALDTAAARLTELESIEWDHAQKIERERTGRLQALSGAKDRSDTLEAHIKDLEAALNVASTKHAELTREAECFRSKSDHLEEVNRKLRLNLQESIGHGFRAGGTPFYHDTANHVSVSRTLTDDGIAFHGPLDYGPSTSRLPSPATPASPRRRPEATWGPVHVPPPSPSKSRFDYPRSYASRKIRGEVLSTRTPNFSYADEHGI